MKVYRIYSIDDPYCGDITEGIVATKEDAIEITGTLNKGKKSYDFRYYEEIEVLTKEEYLKRCGIS